MALKKTKSNPIVLANREWPPPDWVMEEVKTERMIISLCALAKPDQFERDSDYVGDCECLAYMMPATLSAPLDSDYIEIYLYLATRVMKRVKKIDVPEDIRITELSDYRMGLLRDLKGKIFRARNGKITNPLIQALEDVFGSEQKQLTLL